jgi:hypothetical protein
LCQEYCLFSSVQYCFCKAFLVPQQYGRLPIELAAEYGTREDVEILFPFTSPISTVANWSIDGIISHVKMEIKQLEVCHDIKLSCTPKEFLAHFNSLSKYWVSCLTKTSYIKNSSIVDLFSCS